MARPFIYLDNAATTFPKPPCVLEAMTRYALDCGAPARGTHGPALHAARLVDACRERIATLVGLPASHARQVVFTLNCSDALNLAIKGLVLHRVRTQPSHAIHLITSSLDHNSILRPFNALRGDWFADAGISVTQLDFDPATGLIDPDDLQRAITPDTLLFATLHASNVTGAIQPVAQLGRVCRDHGVHFVLDAAQSLGHAPLNMTDAHVDLLAFAGHKGLLGPTGTGGLVIRPEVEDVLDPLREGGTGSRIELDTQPTVLPDKYEPGSHNTLGLIGLSAAVGWLLERTVDRVRSHEQSLTCMLMGGLSTIPGVRVLGSPDPAARVGVVSLTHDTISPIELARRLEAEHGILTRAGLHCAPLAHRALGTTADGGRLGAMRFSIGPFNTDDHIRAAVDAVADVTASATAHCR